MIRRTLLAATLALAVLTPAANAWNSDTFRSPTGNLVCKYRNAYGSIACGAFNSQMIIQMGFRSRPVQGQRLSWDQATRWPVLYYGQRWNAGQPISCLSTFGGMRCQNAAGWYFSISRSGVVVGRYGQDFYKL